MSGSKQRFPRREKRMKRRPEPGSNYSVHGGGGSPGRKAHDSCQKVGTSPRVSLPFTLSGSAPGEDFLP